MIVPSMSRRSAEDSAVIVGLKRLSPMTSAGGGWGDTGGLRTDIAVVTILPKVRENIAIAGNVACLTKEDLGVK